jgi:hypothetical protein
MEWTCHSLLGYRLIAESGKDGGNVVVGGPEVSIIGEAGIVAVTMCPFEIQGAVVTVVYRR